MFNGFMKAGAIFILVCLVTSPASAQLEMRFRIDGSENPGDIPIWVKLDELITKPHSELESASRYWASVLHRLEMEIARMKGMNWVLDSVRFHHFICLMVKDGESVVAITERQEELLDQDDKNLEKRYMVFWDSLPVERQIFLMDYIDSNITPNLVYEKVDYKRASQSYPEQHMEGLINRCGTPLRGELVYEVEYNESGGRTISLSYR